MTGPPDHMLAYQLPFGEVLGLLGTDPRRGLSEMEAGARLVQRRRNELGKAFNRRWVD